MPLNIKEKAFLLVVICHDLRHGDRLSIYHQGAPLIELSCQVVLYRIGKVFVVQMIRETYFTEVHTLKLTEELSFNFLNLNHLFLATCIIKLNLLFIMNMTLTSESLTIGLFDTLRYLRWDNRSAVALRDHAQLNLFRLSGDFRPFNFDLSVIFNDNHDIILFVL
jgi:hypothetical protein